ncbi:DNA helicase RecQ [uncultured Anaerococcus sp.]|uniref:DNA helicase RecQ n=1 Tax=uncultured Anaerococcus sp. TaxID=293428 RepID=UPI002617F49C|nr:DNA helicase RecQ [uncultured Anaerococcus sp.]
MNEEILLGKLKKYFGYDSFKKGQEDLVEKILEGSDVLGVLPTGGGKSICYQLPALIKDGLSLVVSPLISLMKDQVDSLRENGIAAAFINSSLDFDAYKNILADIKKGEIKILYISPERLENEFFREFIRSVDISFVAVDEAHCISQWGHDFRPSYKLIPELYDIVGDVQITAFTATATEKVREDIINNLSLTNPFVKVTGFDRENLYFKVAKPKDKLKFIKDYLNKHEKDSGIIYASTRKRVDELYKNLKKLGYRVSCYHAGLSEKDRKKAQEDFIYDRTKIIVATNAFGMGIDKSDVRYVIHFNMPKDMESYYQEAGRAGRDGEASECILLYSGQDIIINKHLINLGNNFSHKIYQLEKLQTIINYVNTSKCFRHYILNYFGEEGKEECGNCSNCLAEIKKVDATIDAQKILSCIYRLNQKYGVATIVDCLKGSRNKNSREKNLEKVSTFGLMKEKDTSYIKDLVGVLAADGYIKVTGATYPVLKLTEKSKQVLLDGEKILINKIEKEETKITKQESDFDQGLFNYLKAVRLKMARKRNIPPFIIFSDSSLKEMAKKKPKTEEEMLDIKGVGDKKLIQYGDMFLLKIKDYENSK